MEYTEPQRVIPCARCGVVTMRPSSRYENNGEEGRWGTAQKTSVMSKRFQRIPLRPL
jgi:hypothetical protein